MPKEFLQAALNQHLAHSLVLNGVQSVDGGLDALSRRLVAADRASLRYRLVPFVVRGGVGVAGRAERRLARQLVRARLLPGFVGCGHCLRLGGAFSRRWRHQGSSQLHPRELAPPTIGEVVRSMRLELISVRVMGSDSLAVRHCDLLTLWPGLGEAGLVEHQLSGDDLTLIDWPSYRLTLWRNSHRWHLSWHIDRLWLGLDRAEGGDRAVVRSWLRAVRVTRRDRLEPAKVGWHHGLVRLVRRLLLL